MAAAHTYALAARAVQAATMAVAGLGVALGFTLEEQGLFFTFMSLGALMQLGEFGLGYALLQTASHLSACGQTQALQTLLRQARQLAAGLLLLAAGAVGAAGLVLLQRAAADGSAAAAAAQAAWLVYAAAVPLAHAVNLALQWHEGAHSARAAWGLRALQEALAGAVFLVSLLAGAGLWSLAVHAAARATLGAAGLAWLSARRRRRAGPEGEAVAVPVAAAGASQDFAWRRDAWPFQWRVGLSSLAGFLVFQAFNPLLLLEQGAEAAGRFGLTLAIVNMLLLVTGAWPLSQAARYGSWIAQGELAALRAAFSRMLWRSTALAVVLALAVLAAVAVAAFVRHPLADRVADLPTTAALLGFAGCHHLAGAVAVLLRAERREPLLLPSLVGGVLTVLAVWWAARQGGLLGPALASVALSCAGLVWVALLYRRFASRRFAVPAPPGVAA